MLMDILVILALIVLNGVLAMSELAIVSARPARLKPLEGRSKGAAAALTAPVIASSTSSVVISPSKWPYSS